MLPERKNLISFSVRFVRCQENTRTGKSTLIFSHHQTVNIVGSDTENQLLFSHHHQQLNIVGSDTISTCKHWRSRGG